MSSIEAGTRVRVIIEGEVAAISAAGTRMIQTDLFAVPVAMGAPDVQVIPIDPDRPSLDRETIARVLHQSDWPGVDWNEESRGGQGCYLSNAEAVLALIEAAQPGLIR